MLEIFHTARAFFGQVAFRVHVGFIEPGHDYREADCVDGWDRLDNHDRMNSIMLGNILLSLTALFLVIIVTISMRL